MQLISLLLSRGGRRWAFAFVAAFTWLGMCQSAAAAVSCNASTLSNLVIYNGSEISNAPLLTRLDCAGLPVNEPGSEYNLVTLCTTSDASTATGTGGNTVTPWRIARSAANNVLNFQLSSYFAGGSASTPSGPLTQGGLYIGSGNISTSISGNTINSAGGAGMKSPFVTVPASQNVPAGDYVSIVSITVDIRLIKTHFDGNCTEGTSVGTVPLNLPVLIRVGGATCSISYAAPVSLGVLSVTSGTVAVNNRPAGLHLACANGTPWTATLSDGNSALGSADDRRRMVNGGSYINYKILNSDGTPVNLVSGTGTGYNQQIVLNVQIPSQTPSSFTQGIYMDTVIISLSY